MRWIQTRKIRLQTPPYSNKVFYCKYNKGSKCTRTKFPYKIPRLLKYPITTLKKENIHTNFHQT